MSTSADAPPPPPPADPLVGSVFAERYRIEAMLGEGGMGTVYRAHHMGLDCAVAVKLLHPALTADDVVARRFDREAVALSKLDHPNCLRVLDAGTSPSGAKYIVMPLLDGQELRALITGPLPLPRAVELTSQILRGLEHAHRRGLIHRDLKPENVLVVRDDDGKEVAKLVDFGIVKLLMEDANVEPLTRAGLVFGTPRYMSPEQVTGGKITERTDLYAVGVMLFEMLTGNAPFDADDAGMIMRMQILGDVPELPPHVPATIAEIVRRLLEKSPSDRFASARETRDTLDSALLAAAGRTVVAPAVTDPLAATIAAPSSGRAPIAPSQERPLVVALPPAAPRSAQPRATPALRNLPRYAPILAAALLLVLGIVIAVLWPDGPSTSTQPPATPARVSPVVPTPPHS
ncbi:MAG TPA: protein kinase, partial [Nannocystaceae bacterium]|nr:protein kinase [Nannocystaceae bacterium]